MSSIASSEPTFYPVWPMHGLIVRIAASTRNCRHTGENLPVSKFRSKSVIFGALGTFQTLSTALKWLEYLRSPRFNDMVSAASRR